MSADTMFLYWGSGSGPCWKVMLALEEKGFSGYKNKLCSFSKKEHKTPEILALNPRGQLPTFKDGDIVINESTAVLEYLEAVYPKNGSRLLPEDAAGKASVLQVLHELSNIQSNISEKIIYYKFFTPKEKIDENDLKERYVKARTELDIWEQKLKKGGANAFIAGSTFSIADCGFFPFIAFGKRLGLKLDKWPSIESYYKRVVSRPSVKNSWPPHWIDEPEGNKSILCDI